MRFVFLTCFSLMLASCMPLDTRVTGNEAQPPESAPPKAEIPRVTPAEDRTPLAPSRTDPRDKTAAPPSLPPEPAATTAVVTAPPQRRQVRRERLTIPECEKLLVVPDPFGEGLGGRDRDVEALASHLEEAYKSVQGRNIVVLLDGTHNTKESRTNIWRLYTLAVNAACDRPQLARYFRGVGTDSLNRVRGGATGNGLDILIKDAYLYLAQTYRPGDRVFLFGFSRGAYAARSLNGFIEFVGLLDGTRTNDDKDQVNELFGRYNRANDGIANFEARHRVNLSTLKLDYPLYTGDDKVVVEAIGVFDTVAALGLSRDDFPDDHRTELYARKGVHALALDEQRNDFRELPFDPRIRPDQQLIEVWFPGVHGNIGGGYQSGLELVTLNWMLDEMANYEIFENLPVQLNCGDHNCALAPLRDEFLEKSMFGKMGLHWRRVTPGATLHGSVMCRMQGPLTAPYLAREPNGRYEPQNLHEPVKDRYEVIPYNCGDAL
ncbi:MAG: phospholipase effector Tle1 domain-containing protein [Pseudomonadota bacterium]